MKRCAILLLLAVTGLSCYTQTQCRSTEYYAGLATQLPGLSASAASIETFTQNYLRQNRTSVNGTSAANERGFQVITIPVVVHVVYNNSAENITDAQIRSQLDILNQDFRRLNPDTINTPIEFLPFAADCGFQFQLAKVDPRGYATSGILRSHTAIQAFSFDDAVKFTSQGGDDAWNCDQYLNIWVTNLTSGILGYSSVVGGPKERDGITVQYTAFGTIGTAQAPFNRGRTTTHELGHWLNLIHTWGDADCGDDHVADTPPQKGPNRGCPSASVITCGTGPYGDMYMNYMDFTDDRCMNIFTEGQRERMMALFVPGGPRQALLSNTALTSVPIPDTSSKTMTPESGQGTVLVYPNPASNVIYIRVMAPLKPGLVAMFYNEMGQLVMTAPISQPLQQINISGLAPGVYYIRTSDGPSTFVSKLIKF